VPNNYRDDSVSERISKFNDFYENCVKDCNDILLFFSNKGYSEKPAFFIPNYKMKRAYYKKRNAQK